MSKSVLLALTLPLALQAGCTTSAPDFVDIDYPILSLGQASIDFGEAAWNGTIERGVVVSNQGGMTMGVSAIRIGDADENSAFTVTWDADDIECTAAASGDTASADAKDLDEETGVTDPDDTGSADEGEPAPEGTLFLLGAGCQIPVSVSFTPKARGQAYDALIVETVGTELTEEQDDDGQDLPDFLADRVHASQVVYLHGESDYEKGVVVVRPRSYDFGYLHPDNSAEEPPARIEIVNVGNGDITINGVDKSTTCDEAFEFTLKPGPEYLLEGLQSTLVEMSFTPTDTNSSLCTVYIYTDDPANPTIDVSITGNYGSDPDNAPPTVFLRSPESGFRYSSIRPLTLELNIFDQNQPAGSLDCRVRSLVLEETVADCTAIDDSGHVYVEVPAEELQAGVDTLIVTVTDGSNATATASVSVVVNAEYPSDDDDGDGYGVASEPADCDDGNIFTYPSAAEIFDLADNDCDGTIDEGTDGFDDDLDGYSEHDGDCNDYNELVYPVAPERGDGLDNDCDGFVDENTDRSDDDGDGYAENNDDCDDSNAAINPGAIEVCDGLDNDCDGLRDSADGCEDTDSDPIIVGNVIRMEQSACLEFEVVTMDVMVFDADRDALVYQWSTDDGGGTFDSTTSAVVHFTAPEIAGDTADSGKNNNIYAIVFDADGNQDWASGKLAVWDAATKLYDPFSKAVVNTTSGCASTGGGAPGALVLAGAALALALRRRK